MKSKSKIIFARKLRQNMTEAERKLWYNLRNRNLFNHKFRRQEPVDLYIVDFICYEEKLIIELDGGQHDIERDKDIIRDEYLRKKGYKVLRFWNNEVLGNINGVLEMITEALTPALSQREREFPKGDE